MAIAFAQHLEVDMAAASSHTLTLSAVSAGDHVIVFVNTLATITISGLGATWSQLQTDAGGYRLWSGVNCAAGGTSITVTLDSSSFAQYGVSTWSGAGGVDTSAINSGSSATPATPSVTPAATGKVVVGGWFQSGLADTWSSFVDNPSAWTTIVGTFSDTNRRYHSAYVANTTSATTESASNSVSRGWGSFAAVLAFASAPVPIRRRRLVLGRAVSRASVI